VRVEQPLSQKSGEATGSIRRLLLAPRRAAVARQTVQKRQVGRIPQLALRTSEPREASGTHTRHAPWICPLNADSVRFAEVITSSRYS
jgi:hypothetical protein